MQEASSDSPHDKTSWRRYFRARINALGDTADFSVSIRSHLSLFLQRFPPRRIAAFAPLPGEPDLLPLVVIHSHHDWHFPRIIGEDLAFAAIGNPEQLQSWTFAVREPDRGSETVPVEALDLFLCPGLGFDLQGTRLGRGGGFYDRALSRAHPGALRIGVAFDQQLVPTLPHETHDLPMTHVVTPKGLQSLSRLP